MSRILDPGDAVEEVGQQRRRDALNGDAGEEHPSTAKGFERRGDEDGDDELDKGERRGHPARERRTVSGHLEDVFGEVTHRRNAGEHGHDGETEGDRHGASRRRRVDGGDAVASVAARRLDDVDNVINLTLDLIEFLRRLSRRIRRDEKRGGGGALLSAKTRVGERKRRRAHGFVSQHRHRRARILQS